MFVHCSPNVNWFSFYRPVLYLLEAQSFQPGNLLADSLYHRGVGISLDGDKAGIWVKFITKITENYKSVILQ